MTKYASEYRRLEKEASAAEAQVDRSQRVADKARYDQCRVCHEAVTVGGLTQTAFARELGINHSTVCRRAAIWVKYRVVPLAARPSFGEAWANSAGSTQAEESSRKQKSNARAVMRDPAGAREVLADPHVRAIAQAAIQSHHRAQPAPKSSRPSKDDAFLRCVDDMARVDQSLTRLVENLNEGRKNGFLSPSVLREFVDKLRLYADAIDEIAGSRGLTDEALAEWIGAE